MNRLALDNLQTAIANLKRSTIHLSDADDIFAKFDAALEQLRGLGPNEADSPGRREAAAAAAVPEAETPAEEKKDEPTVAQSFEQAAEIAKERLSAAA